MDMIIRKYARDDAEETAVIWGRIVKERIAFPQTDCLTKEGTDAFFSKRFFMGTVFDKHNGAMVDLYILHSNNVRRRGHICNVSYAVKQDMRGWQIREKLVHHCMEKGRGLGFDILQFNAVVRTNEAALHLYQKLGFTRLGVTSGGFLMKDGRYEDTISHYIVL